MQGQSGLQAVLPRYDVAERHRRLVRAPAAVTFEAFEDLTPAEVPLAALLSAVRSLPARLTGRPGPPVRQDQPILDQFVAAGFAVLDHRPGREIVVGVIAQMWKLHGAVVRPDSAESFTRFDRPGFVKAAFSFTVTEERGATWAITETRVAATDAAARRAFRRYWRLIRPFSGLVRRSWLRGVAARAVTPDTFRDVRHVLQVTTSTHVAAPPETVFDVYADYRTWPSLFPTIRAVRLVHQSGPTRELEVDHIEGRVRNQLVLSPPRELRLWEEKRHYDALFVNHFDPVPDGTRFTVTGHIRFKGAARMVSPFLGGLVRRRMQRLQQQPVKDAAQLGKSAVRS